MSKKAAPPAKPLAGQKVAFVGAFRYYFDKYKHNWAREAGATVVEPTDAFDYLVYGDGRGGKPPGDVAKIEKRLPAVASLDMAAFAKLVLPAAEAIARGMKSAKRRGYDGWDAFDALLGAAGTGPDLSSADLRGADLYGAKFSAVTLDDADLRDVNAEYAYFHNLRRAKFDKADAKNVYLGDADDCTFRGANLEKAWFFYGSGTKVLGCDFGGAKMPRARGSRGAFTDCTFAAADLSDADLAGSTFAACDLSKADLTRVQAHKSKFTDVKFVGAVLHRADLRETSLKGADLRKADLREAALGGADLTGADVAGADFAGAVLTGATLKGVDFSKAKNYTPPVVRVAGPKLTEFAQAAAGAKAFVTTAEAELGAGEHAAMRLGSGRHGVSASARVYRDREDTHNWITAPTFAQGLLNMADRWPKATLRLDTVTAKGSPTVRGAKLQALAVAAWAEAFGAAPATDLEGRKAAQGAEALKARDELMKKVLAKGVEVWNGLDYRERDRIDLSDIDLSDGFLEHLNMWGRADLRGANFARAALTGAELWSADLHAADFSGANLTRARLEASKCEKASFAGANLKNANLSSTKLFGADFTGANLSGANLDKAQFDEHTKFPTGFQIPDAMVWKGEGPRPGLRSTKLAAPGSVTFEAFFKTLAKTIDASRIAKATAMLKAERFQLYADVTDDALAGVVKSQSSKELVYSCRLASDGQFGCGTQNLKPCGGLAGSLCKHLLVLVVGLAKAGALDPATAGNWVAASKAHKPALDKDAASETFLKYKGAEAGDIDWRPTETVPEDFYAM